MKRDIEAKCCKHFFPDYRDAVHYILNDLLKQTIGAREFAELEANYRNNPYQGRGGKYQRALELGLFDSFPAGYCHFPKYDSEYFKQLTAEQLVTKVVKGYQKREWQKTRERNEALDCRIYARAASISYGIEQFSETKWRNLEKAVTPEKPQTPVQPTKKKRVLSFKPNIVKAQDPYL